MNEVYTSALKIFQVLDVLCRNFAVGVGNKEIAKSCGIAPPTVTRCLNTLVEAGYAEQVTGTDRYRASVRMAQKAFAVSRSIENEQSNLDQLKGRISRRYD